MNDEMAKQVIGEALKLGVREFCVSPGGRNAPLINTLVEQQLKCYYWHEERSSTFFAIGRSRNINAPVAVVTTSGSAVGELLPGVMEAHYSGIPLLLITADRPRRFRGTGAPQSAEQVDIFGPYVSYAQDLADSEMCCLNNWDRKSPAHINLCFEETIK